MKENKSHMIKIIILLGLCFLMSQAQSSNCTRERCCSLTTCTSLYCQQKSSQTWISTQNYDNYQFTKLVMANNQCRPCAYNCKACTSQSVCTQCYDGFYLETVSNLCQPCEYKCTKCQVLNSISKCSQCQTGAYLDTSTLTCKMCPMGAKSCADQTSIVQCNPGYLKSSNSLFCTPCPSNCISCPSSTSSCSVCEAGYYVNGTQCKKCNITNCDTCVGIGSTVYCTQCSVGYFRSSSTVCSSCPLNCRICTNAAICTTCKTNYFIQGGGCSVVSNPIPNCNTFSNFTVNGTNTCISCLSGYYLSSSSLQCIPCSITCTSCYGDHFGRCTACISSAKLFNQMCLPTPYKSSNQLQLYYTAAANPNLFLGGSLICSSLLYMGSQISLLLNNLASYKLVINYRIFTSNAGQLYSVSLNSTTNVSSLSSTNNSVDLVNQTSSLLGYQICSSTNSSYYAHISSTTFSTVKINNTLKFAATSPSANVYVSQILITAYKCSSLCLECSQSQCFICMTANLYKQDAYCVYVCSKQYYTYQNQKQCVKDCPIGTYPLLTNLSCMACVSPCVTCLNDKYCLSCISGYFLSTQTYTCQISCPYRYFGSVKTQKCQQCVGRCNQCVNDQQCLTCQVGFLQNTSCVDNCISGYYQNISTLKCQLCSSQCLTCQYKFDYCTTCPTGFLFYNNTCIASCPLNYFPNSATNACQVCSYPCEQCTSPTLCISCVDSYLLNNACLTSCPNAYYQDNILLKCQPCSSVCTRCISSSTNCIQCIAGYKLLNNQCISSCPDGFYPEQLANISIIICSKCVGVCQTCLNQTYCLSCNSNFLVSNNSGLCVRGSLCNSNEFANIVNLKCEPCASVCMTCYYYADWCTSCHVGLVLYNNTCIGACPSQYFYQLTISASNFTSFTNITVSSSVSICTICQEPCLTCIDQLQCLSCIQGYKFSIVTHICSSTCSIGSFFNKTINDCQACSTNCLNCDSPMFCSICNISTYLYIISSSQNQCRSSCPDGYYSDTYSCMKCLYPCLLCTSSIDCLSCSNGVFYQNRCLSGCPESTFMNTANNTCQNCSSNCLTCKNSSTTCTSCRTGLYYISSNFSCISTCPNGTYSFDITKSCLKCPQSCSSCMNSSYCTACIAGQTYLDSTIHACVQFCPSGKFGNVSTGLCESCSFKCQTCSGNATQCLTCATNYLLTRLENAKYDCVTSCPSKYYNDSSICYHCIFPCKQCSSASKCLSCVSGTFFHNQSQSCLISCPLGTYYTTVPSTQCKTCISPCQTCKNQTMCISCANGYFLHQGKCLSSCPIKYYPDGSRICNKCYGLCQTCQGKYQCLTCLTGFQYSGYCYSTCPPGTFASLSTKKCQPCQDPCLQCTGTATYCKKCRDNNLFAYRGGCSSNCPVGTFVNGQVCEACKFPCVKCSNQFSCEQCLGGYLLYMNVTCIQNANKCPNDLYKLNFKQCVPSTWCPLNYYRDQQLKTCSFECSPQKYFNRKKLTCLNKCGQGQYVSKSMECKNWTDQIPTSLMAMQAISFIKSSEIHIAVNFNETVQWLRKGQNLFTVKSLEMGRRLLSVGQSQINYTISSTQQLILQVSQMPYNIDLNLPAHYLQSSSSGYNLQNSALTVRLPDYVAYTYEQVYVGSIMKQFSEGISWFIIIFSLFFLFMNRLSDVYILWDTSQLLFLLIFLDIQYPPNLNQFLVGLSNIHFLFVPSLFANVVPSKRFISSKPFYAYSYDNSFLRTAGSPLLLVVIVIAIFAILKFMEILIKHCNKVREKMDEYPKIKNSIFQGILRFRWHHTSDLFFVSYDIVVIFAVAQIASISSNPNNIGSNVASAFFLVLYLAFPCFVSYKLYRHFGNISKGKMVTNLQCFYRGIEKTNKFGISLILVRYFRKLTYCLIIGIFTSQPMFALPILMFTSVLFGLFLFINKPFKKRLSNIINVGTEIFLVLLYILIALIQFGQQSFSIQVKVILGWVCCGLLLIVLFALIYQIFCKTMFYLQPQGKYKKSTNNNQEQNDLTKKFTQQYLRQKAGQFFDQYFPKLKQNFNLDDSQQMLNQYQQGDSQNSQNNEERQKNWGINSESESKRSDQFRHYGENDSEQGTGVANSNKENKAPNYLIRCVKELK